MVSLGARSAAFNLVGLAGAAVQLGVLAALVAARVPPVPAAALAVECAVLHNFAWHQRWTWRDRPAHSRRQVACRLARFHALNGAISIVGNVALMAVLTSRCRMHPVVANLIAIAACSIANFLVSETLVFAPAAGGISSAGSWRFVHAHRDGDRGSPGAGGAADGPGPGRRRAERG